MTTHGHEEKRYDPKDTTLKFVNRPDDLDPLRKHKKMLQRKETSVSEQRCPAVMPSLQSLSLGGVAACWIRASTHLSALL